MNNVIERFKQNRKYQIGGTIEPVDYETPWGITTRSRYRGEYTAPTSAIYFKSREDRDAYAAQQDIDLYGGVLPELVITEPLSFNEYIRTMPEMDIEEGINIAPIKYIHSYLQSPGFRKRLQLIQNDGTRSAYYNSIIDNMNQPIRVINRDYSPINRVLGLFNDKFWAKNQPPGSYNSGIGYIALGDYDTAVLSSIVPDEDFILAHEYGHKIDPTDQAIPFSYDPYWDRSKAPQEYLTIHKRKNVDRDNIHDSAYTETYADLMATRYDLYKLGIYDSRSARQFNEQDYNQYIDYLKSKNLHNRLIEQFDKDDFIELINTVAQNNSTQDEDLNNSFLQGINTYLPEWGSV